MVVLETKINGATVRFHDDAYAGVSDEEIERRKRQARIVCERILMNHTLREENGLPHQRCGAGSQ